METNKQKQYEEMAKQYFAENKTIDEKTLSAFLQMNDWRLYDIYDKFCKICDIKDELNEREIKFTDEDIELVLEKYEEYLGESDDWHICLNEAIWSVFDEDEGV